MKNESRTSNSIRNIIYAIAGYFCIMLLKLVARGVFIKQLTTDYLGLSGLFSGVLSILALSELGVGSAMVFSMYKPVAQNDKERIKSLLYLYKKLYRFIGCFILIAGTLVTPFIGVFIKGIPNIPYLKLYFIMYVVNSGISYFLIYKRSILTCNQQAHIETTTTTVKSILLTVSQIAILFVTRSYFLYLTVQIIYTVAENIAVSVIAEKRYPYICERNITPLPKDDLISIKKNIFAMISHKIGCVVVFATDNVIISKLLGLTAVGSYSNYMLIIDNITSVLRTIIFSLSASVGNLIAGESKLRCLQILNAIVLISFWIYSFCAISMFVLFQDFITIWLGNEYLFDLPTVVILVITFYVTGMRNPVIIFKNASGTFYYDRFKPIVESLVNLAASIPLTFAMGIGGVKLGTLISTLGVAFWVEAHVLFKHYLNEGEAKYFIKQLSYFLLFVISGSITFYLSTYVKNVSVIGLVYKSVLCLTIPNVIYLLLFCRTEEFITILRLIKKEKLEESVDLTRYVT